MLPARKQLSPKFLGFCPKWRHEKGPFLTVACCPRHLVLWLSKAITPLPVSCLAHACGCRMWGQGLGEFELATFAAAHCRSRPRASQLCYGLTLTITTL